MARMFGGKTAEELTRLSNERSQGLWQANGPYVYKNDGKLPYDIAHVETSLDSCVENSHAIAAAVNALPDLLAEVVRMKALLKRARIYVPCDEYKPHTANDCSVCKLFHEINAALEDR